MSNENNLSNGAEGTIPVSDALTMTQNWRTYLAASQQGFVARSFVVPIINFTNILATNPEADGVRVYIGLEDATDPITAKLIFVPTVNNHDIPYIHPEGNLGGDGNTNVYDLTTVCPPNCVVGDSLLDGNSTN